MTCQNCQAQTAPGIYLCARCVVRLEDMLTQVEDALEVAEDTIAKQDRMGSGGVISGANEAPIPINLDTMEKRRTLWEAVVTNAREVLDHDDSDDLRGVQPVIYLRMSTDLIAHQKFAGELLDQLEGATRKLWSSVDRRPDIVALGQCGAVHESVPCPGVLRAQKGDPFTRCRVCGATHNAEELRQERAANAWEHFAPLSEVVKVVRQSGWTINPKSAQRWATEGNLKVLRYREDGVALYSPGQVIDVHQEMKNRRGGRPRKVA